MIDCERCGTICSSTKALITHQNKTIYCNKYQNIIFLCFRCGFNTKGIKNIDKHMQNCTGTNTSNPLQELATAQTLINDEKRLYKIKITTIEKKIKEYEQENITLKLQLTFEQMKNKIYSQIISSQTSIDLNNIIQETNDNIHIYNYNNGNIPITVHNFIDETKKEKSSKYTIKITKEKNKKKTTIKSKQNKSKIQRKKGVKSERPDFTYEIEDESDTQNDTHGKSNELNEEAQRSIGAYLKESASGGNEVVFDKRFSATRSVSEGGLRPARSASVGNEVSEGEQTNAESLQRGAYPKEEKTRKRSIRVRSSTNSSEGNEGNEGGGNEGGGNEGGGNEGNKGENNTITEEHKHHQTTYRKVKQTIDRTEKDLTKTLNEYIKIVDKETEQIVYNNFDVSYKEITENIELYFSQIENTRIYTKSLKNIKDARSKLLGKLNIDEYVKLLLLHIQRLQLIFLDKNYDNKKTTNIISQSLTSLDMRLIFYGEYYNTNIELDDIEKFRLAISVLIEYPKQFTVYSPPFIYNNFKNYSICLFNLKKCIEQIVINKYGFNNIIYLQYIKSKENDPYSFYTLDKVDTKRCWRMECRLEDFTNDFIDEIKPYCVELFRKIYKDVFSDNTYRTDYKHKTQITQFDCEQLLQNILTISQPIKLCKLFQSIIVKNCTFTPTDRDKFNLCGDDRLQQKRFISNSEDINNMHNTIKQLFNNISAEEIKNVLNFE
jgi:hypothetical protein